MPSTRRGESSRIPLVAAAAVFVVHLIANPHYGFFRDELYFIICGRHPQWGYVDQPPVVPLLAALTQVFGHSLLLLRAVPALCAAVGAYVTCLLVIEFGGGAFAQALAALVYFFTPVLASFGMKAGTDELGLVTWPLMALLVVRLTRGADARLWLLVGAVAGISLKTKYSVIFFVVALFAGLLATGERRALFTPWLAGGVAVAVLIALPNVLWQAHYGFPMMELLRNGQNGKNVIPSPAGYALQELLITNPLLAAAWISGLLWLSFAPGLRFLAFAYVVLIAEMLGLHGKHYYPANVYPILIAAGGVTFEAWTNRFRALRGFMVAYAVLAGLVVVPDVLPVLPEGSYVTYARVRNQIFHVNDKMTETEHGREGNVMPADWADMHGWPEMAAAIKRAYDALPPGERSRAIVLAGNYGEASAVAFFTPDVPVVSPHNQFWLWGLHGFSGSPTVQINGTCFAARKLFGSRTRVATFSSPWAIGDETNIPIWICRDPVEPLSTVWNEIKNYN